MKKFLLLATLLVVTRFADAQTTYLYTSNLKKESNPLVSLFGFGWTGLFVAETIGLCLVIYALWIYCFKNVQVYNLSKTTSLKDFISLFYFGDRSSFFKLFYRLPTNKNSLLYSLGYILTYSLLTVSLIIVSSTTLLLTNHKYRDFYYDYRIPVWLYIFCGLIVAFYSFRFYIQEFKLRTIA